VLEIHSQPGACGALVSGVDLAQTLEPLQVQAIRNAWLDHQVLGFPDQHLDLDALERLALALGDFGEDPFFESIPGHPHVAEVRRNADETTPLFAESWHSDWSFLPKPPSGTLLQAKVIPPVGGDTLFADQYAAWEALKPSLKKQVKNLQGIHSARRGYAPDGLYGADDVGRSMAIRYSDSAMQIQAHPIALPHPETGRIALFVNPGYTIGIEGMNDAAAWPLLRELFEHQTQPEFCYRHHWSDGMLTLWDNRCVLHAATGGYDGFERVLHRITLAAVSVESKTPVV